MIAGRGVKATIDGDIIFAGNSALLIENSIIISQNMLGEASKYINDGCTIIYVAINDCEAGFVALSDTLRKDSV